MEKLSEDEVTNRLKNLKGWEYKDGSIERSYKFKNFKDAFSIMTRIAFECEQQNHHPDWSNVYSSLNIRLNTHDVGGITENDFKLAESIEKIVNS
ncbi:4a-hydroxytetrahydrobiopterin dehydratase [uncultured Eudoraea sp.]|uniref:4a-hydroxytetrahydrobiopterin dehydratase n=1 Tax=uncultured Eudoraea sp. TaxID=1035614 RepID=UPI002624A856|nr:4a-hydroxytetrahydrobiopterin dehydratase [uncultured Eudoraea sp.]